MITLLIACITLLVAAILSKLLGFASRLAGIMLAVGSIAAVWLAVYYAFLLFF